MAGSSHGHTPAAWTGVTIAFIGFCISGAFMVLASPVGFWAGMGVTVLGGIVGWIMKGMGLGQPKDQHASYQALSEKRQPAGVEG